MPCENSKTTTSSEIEHVDWSTGSAAQCNNARCGSQSSQVSQNSGDICRICHCESDTQNPLLTPCYCSGSLKYVHQTCLQQWLTASETNFCELCKFPFIMHTKIKPLHEWRSLDISGIERRRLCCSALFHCAAALCVIWSLCVLIERAADDVQHGLIDWPFWTKLAVVTVGLTGGVIFMYIQCKAYLHLCHRWKARNRILLIQNAPEKVNPFPHASPIPQHQPLQQQHQQLQQQQQQQHQQQQQQHFNQMHQQQQQLQQNQQQQPQQTQQQLQQNHHNHYQNMERIHMSGTVGADAIERHANDCGNNAAHRNLGGISNNINNNAHNVNKGMMGGDTQVGSCMVENMHETDSLYSHERVPYHNSHDHHHNHHHHHHHHHHNHEQLLHDLEHGDNDCLMGNTRSSTSNIYQVDNSTNSNNSTSGMVGQNHLGQVAVSANIECSQSQHNYERDWALDDVVSQISSFRPCPQGSGSMTPFHDSIHNVLEHSTATSSCISVNEADSDNLAIDIGKTISAPTYGKHTPTSFDATTVSETGILDNSGATRSAIIDAGGSSLCSSVIDGFIIQAPSLQLSRQQNHQQPHQQHHHQEQQQQQSYNIKEKSQVPIDAMTMTTNVRRHSDTKLLDDDIQQQQQQQQTKQQQTFYINLNDANNTLGNEQMHKLLSQTSTNDENDAIVLDIDLPRNIAYNGKGYQQNSQKYYHHHNNHHNEDIYNKERDALDIIVYDKADVAHQCNNDKQHEQNYKYKQRQQQQQQQQQQQVLWHHQPDIHNSRRMFKSLPNLSRSHENLLRK